MGRSEFTPPHAVPVNVYFDRPEMPFETIEPIVYRNTITTVEIPAKFRLDFASVPRLLWWIYPRVGRYVRAALVHDALYREGLVGRIQADALFLTIMKADQVPAWQRWPMYGAVRCFGWKPWKAMRLARRRTGKPLIECDLPRGKHSTDVAASSIGGLLIAAVVFLLLIAATAYGQCDTGVCATAPQQGYTQPQGQPPSAAVMSAARATAKIVHQEASGQGSLGSGVLIDRDETHSYFLTCAHLFTEAGRTHVEHQGQKYPARIVNLDRQHDLALLRTPPVPGRIPRFTNQSNPTGLLWGCGYGGNGQRRLIGGPIRGMATAQGALHPSIRFVGPARSGDSGGPLFNQAGEVVGVVWGQRNGESYAMHGQPVRRLLGRLFPRWRARRQAEAPPPATFSEPPRRPLVPVPRPKGEAPSAPVSQDPGPAGPAYAPPAADPLPWAGGPWPDPTPDPAQPAAEPPLRERLRDAVPAAAGWGLRQVVAGGLAAGGPIGLGILAAGWFVRRRYSSGDVRGASPTPGFPAELRVYREATPAG